jgi:hypothetical protein
VPELAFRWDTTAGPFFGNHLGLLTLDGRTAEFALKKSAFDGPTTRATPVPEASRDLTALARNQTR